jgi:predicted membrane-bound mannosyltransferase
MLTGAALALMQATKETFILNIVAAVGAWLLITLTSRCHGEARVIKFDRAHLTAGAGIWLVIVVLLFTSFFTDSAGPVDSVRTYLPWMHRAGGDSPHIHGWSFYLERLLWFHSGRAPVWSEGLIVGLAVIGTIAIFVRKTFAEGNAAFMRFVLFYTALLTVAYCMIGYKTPWCLLNFLIGMILLAGFGAMAVIDWLPGRALKILALLALLAGAGQLASQAWQAAVPYAASRSNPYVYGQTSPSLLDLVDQVQSLAQVSPRKNETLIKVMSPEGAYWPLPWYLRQFENVGWWSEVPAEPLAPVMIVSTKLRTNFDDDKSLVMAGIYELRPQTFFELYVNADLWRAHLDAMKPTK